MDTLPCIHNEFWRDLRYVDGAKTNTLPKFTTVKSCTKVHTDYEDVHHLNIMLFSNGFR